MGEDILIVKKEKGKDRSTMRFKVVEKVHHSWNPSKYEKIIANKDYDLLAYLFYDLHSFGFPIEKAYIKFKEFINKPELFFLE